MTFGGAMSSSNRVGEVMKEKTEVTVQNKLQMQYSRADLALKRFED